MTSDPQPAPGSPAPVPPDVLVVGGGLAALRTVAALREHGYDGTVRVLGSEGVEPYDRPPLSKHLLDRPTPAWLADDLGHDLHALADEVHLDRPARSLRAADGGGAVVTTDRGDVAAACVVLATGAHAVTVPGWRARTLHTAADADALRTALGAPARRLVVVGAGWIGAEVAGVAAAAGHAVTVLEARPAPLTAALGDHVGGLTVPWYAAAGVDLRTGVQVAGVDDRSVHLADGTHVPADAVLVAVGARPATQWLTGAVPLRGGAVPVDESYRVLGASGPLPGLHAVGDVAVRRSRRHGWVAGGHWDEALHGPDVLVRRLLGVPVAGPEATPYVFSTQLGHDLTLFGLPGGDDTVTILGDPAADGWTALWHRDDTVTGVLVVDRPRDVGAARRLLARDDLPRVALPDAAALPDDLRTLLRAVPAT
ncbi:FAD-dependent oxidoreductase [Cellulomonas sp. zg-ZUI199]|uniref:FAD-dependent oxidoreductase n=1 Tax=Cellulomonas wangleii TaxID=2816956 RepID=A0ABX8D353_9CELL|nr:MULTISPECIES: FAD-dependent oxidoreductase [Cellulomonas]MBO0899769.1 FAD-dependent oxidoreductase [Cellulomonas sp. zg-ZUI22]MBO0922951.1 FAD-dependent oxidoreductase [Cellulomonas wangleii]QVI61345.1 FAD-dependent oxidoreductase [Cellulomonas wangleii]